MVISGSKERFETRVRALPGGLFLPLLTFPGKRYECAVLSLRFVFSAACEGVCNCGLKARSLGFGQHVRLVLFFLAMECMV